MQRKTHKADESRAATQQQQRASSHVFLSNLTKHTMYRSHTEITHKETKEVKITYTENSESYLNTKKVPPLAKCDCKGHFQHINYDFYPMFSSFWDAEYDHVSLQLSGVRNQRAGRE